METVSVLTYSTGHAARLCGVTSDTVLKWIKGNKIAAIRTAGGHYRIRPESLSKFISPKETVTTQRLPESLAQVCHDGRQRCWDYWTGDEVRKNCERCIVYLSQAEFCYVLKQYSDLKDKVLCGHNCTECSYHELLTNEKPKILVVTEDEQFMKNLKKIAGSIADLRFACCNFTFSTSCENFVPDKVIVDKCSEKAGVEEVYSSIMNDPKYSGARVYLAINDHEVIVAPQMIENQTEA